MLLKENQKYDNYYIIQLIQNNLFNEYKIFLRWGRVDTAGQCQVLHPKHLKEALKVFEDKFYEKTGIEWNLRYTQLPLIDMYEWIKPPRQQQTQKILNYQPIQNFHNQETGQKRVNNNLQVHETIPGDKLQNQVNHSTQKLQQYQQYYSVVNNEKSFQNGQLDYEQQQQDMERSNSLGLMQIMNETLETMVV
eukprot:TRINITY_DN5530_c0_g7_i1.p2 TRINITY_DN5530_c0_g7~~TRINITY_DN5530_c0_g7_i1.p2  ORF type:complete len:192 (-),score=24.94 TRINITY_DN5530_c0_g7_i1:92-667(-)